MDTVSLGLKFGGQVYTFTGVDLILDDVSNTPGLEGMCLSAIFVLGSILENQIIGAGGPAWIVGDAFLKNVYSVFRSVDLPFVHPRLFNPTPDLRTLRQERYPVQSALLGLVVWMVVSQRTAQRCTRLQHLRRALTYQLPPVSLTLSPLSRARLTIMVLRIRTVMARPVDGS